MKRWPDIPEADDFVKKVIRMKNFDKNPAGRDFVVGDLHGEGHRLLAMLDHIGFDFNNDRLFSVGDLVDRGLHSRETLELIYKPWFHACIGNHELMMLVSMYYKDSWMQPLWFQNGGVWSLHEVDDLTPLASDILRYMCIAMTIQVNDSVIGIIHADPPKVFDEAHITDDELKMLDCPYIWGRTYYRMMPLPVIEKVDKLYMGHTIHGQATTNGQFNWIDTGAFHKDGYITVVDLTNDHIYREKRQ